MFVTVGKRMEHRIFECQTYNEGTGYAYNFIGANLRKGSNRKPRTTGAISVGVGEGGEGSVGDGVRISI
jgi:hypothetical protein